MRSRLDAYVRSKMMKVQGGQAARENATLVRAVHDVQRAAGIRGAVGEIGVHHGRFLILLHLLLQEGERSFAIDLFDRQEENIDRSGKGDMQRFRENLKACTDDPERCVIIAENSLRIQPERIISEVGKVRLLSVDGGHYEEAVASDLRLAQACLVGGGVAIVDDFFNHDWPGVAAGTAPSCSTRNVRYFPSWRAQTSST